MGMALTKTPRRISVVFVVPPMKAAVPLAKSLETTVL